jgi:hypothetical protein
VAEVGRNRGAGGSDQAVDDDVVGPGDEGLGTPGALALRPPGTHDTGGEVDGAAVAGDAGPRPDDTHREGGVEGPDPLQGEAGRRTGDRFGGTAGEDVVAKALEVGGDVRGASMLRAVGAGEEVVVDDEAFVGGVAMDHHAVPSVAGEEGVLPAHRRCRLPGHEVASRRTATP